LFLAPLANAAAPPTPRRLTDEDRKFLDGLFAFLVSPVGAECVKVPVLARTEPRVAAVSDVVAWRFPAGERKPPRIVGPDGRAFLPRGGVKRLDFAVEYRKLLDDGLTQPLAGAAWLYRLGHESLAARLLAEIEDRDEAVRILRRQLARAAYNEMALAYFALADLEALASGKHLLRLYPAEAGHFSDQTPALIDDIRRRQKAGTLGVKKVLRPPGFEGWPIKRRIAHLIDALDSAGVGESGMGAAWGPFRYDDYVGALVEIGEDAMPALLDAFEKDTRLSRRVTYRRSAGWRLALPVRNAALEALRRTLHVEAFLRHVKADDGPKAAAQIRAYLKEYGPLPLHRRMLAHLLDIKASPAVWRESARTLARIGGVYEREWTRNGVDGRHPVRPNPALSLDRPTAAEAILLALDRDLAADAAATERPYFPVDIREAYLSAITELRDPRALPLLHRRARGATAAERRYLARACWRLGSSGPLEDYARDFDRALLTFPPGEDGKKEFEKAMWVMIATGTPACTRVLDAVAKPGHWAHKATREAVLAGRWITTEEWFRHPYWIRLLENDLADKGENGTEMLIVEGRLTWKSPDSQGVATLMGDLSDPAKRHRSVKERHCDRAGELITNELAGVPMCHALFKDEDERLRRLKGFLAKYRGRIRGASRPEGLLLGWSPWDGTVFIPDLRPLGRPATEADVNAGRAVFHLGGKGRPAELPASRAVAVKGERGLVVQAESDGEGKMHYGVIFRHSIRRVDAKDAGPVKTGE
jgi:hypothetical protein